MYVFYNPNPRGVLVGDCVIRAISKIMNKSWEDTYLEIAIQGFMMKDIPSSNNVWGAYLRSEGFSKRVLPDTCPECYTIKEFCEDFRKGSYILATGTHVVAVIDGDYYDSWDSGNETPTYYWRKGEQINGNQ